MKWWVVRRSGFLIVIVALWYTLFVPLTVPSTFVGYSARVAIVIVGFWFFGKQVLSRIFSHRLPLGTTILVCAITVVFTTNAVASSDPRKLIDCVVFFGGIAGFWAIASHYPMDVSDVVAYVGIALGASVLLVFADTSWQSHEFGLIPFTGENWRVNIRGPHFTGRSGFFLLLASLLLSKKNGWRLVYLFLFIGAVYIVIFSGSRSSMAAAIATLGLWYFRPIRELVMKNRIVALMIPVLAGAAMHLAPILIFQALSVEGFMGTLLKISPGQEDVTAGRLVTWLYHLDLFANNFWTGVPVSAVAETGENIPIELKGSNESFFTRVLAVQGVWGFAFYFTFMYLSWLSVINKSYSSYILSVVFIIITSVDGVFGTMYNVYSIIGYWLYFSLLSGIGKNRL